MRQFVLLATQRSGTNMLRSLLRTAPGLQVFPEIFHGRPRAGTRMPEGLPRFFEFVAADEEQGLGRGNPDAGPELVARYLDRLAQSAPPGISAQLLDIKYNSLHHAEDAWRTPSAPPKMLWML